MPDVFQVLQKDHDEVKAMLVQLEEGPRASTGATHEQLMFRKRAVDQVIIEESKHEAAEQQYFWPAVKRLGPDGLRVAELGLEQEAEAEPVLAELDKLQPDDEGFEERLAVFTSAARAHIAYEEAHAWPLLRASISADEAQLLGEQITRAKKLAPTRPHPHVPPQPGAVKTAGQVAGVADRLRDAVTGRGKATS
jgi:Hemerythrin HHE cation binding domain